MYPNGIAIIAITRRGAETAVKIRNALRKAELPVIAYAPPKYGQEGAVSLDKKLDVFIKEIYPTVDAIVAVMATGIIIRAVAPLLQGKLVDPAVVGVDASGKFVVSLLSGHSGGANELTRIVAEGIGATPVITTASDVMGKQSVDEIARTQHLTIVNPESLVAVNAAIVNGERFVLILAGGAKLPTDAACGYPVEKAENAARALEILQNYDAGAIVTQEPVTTTELPKPITILKPLRIIIGLGARKDVSEDQVLEAISSALERANLAVERVDGLATVDIKKEEQGMIDAAEKLGLGLSFVSVAELQAFKHEGLSPDSEMVEEKIGVGGVCERAALIAAGKNAKLILKKMKLNGVTAAVAEGE